MKVWQVLTMASAAASAVVTGAPAWGGLGAHEHGVGDLTVAVEGTSVELMLTAPSGDLVGLERAPAGEAELEALRQRVAALESGSWFNWDGPCQQVAVAVTLPAVLTTLASTAGGDDHGHHDHGEHGHRDHADAGHREHKGHEHKGHDHEGQRDPESHDHDHFDGSVHWQYRCESGTRLRHVDVQLFDLLPLERIRAQTISERGQGAGQLNTRARRLSLP